MSTLNLITGTKAILTRTDLIPDPTDATKTIPSSYPCDLDGNRLQSGVPLIPIYRDIISGKTYAQIAERLPSTNDAQSVQLRTELQALSPIHFVSDDGSVNGLFVVAPDYNNRESKAPAPAAQAAPAPAAQAGSIFQPQS